MFYREKMYKMSNIYAQFKHICQMLVKWEILINTFFFLQQKIN